LKFKAKLPHARFIHQAPQLSPDAPTSSPLCLFFKLSVNAKSEMSCYNNVFWEGLGYVYKDAVPSNYVFKKEEYFQYFNGRFCSKSY